MKIIFFGTPLESKKVLENISEKHDIVAVVSKKQPTDTRRRTFEKSEIFKFCEQKNILFLDPQKLNIEFEKTVKNLKPDISVVCAYGKILNKTIIETPKYGTINIHPSMLPMFRGPSPIQATILNKNISTGFTIIQMSEGIDSGDILFQSKKIKLTRNETYNNLLEHLFFESSKVINKVISDIENNKIIPIPQNHQKATFTKLILKKEGLIDWNFPSDLIFAKFRAFNNWPKVYSFHNNKRFIIMKLEKTELPSNSPGRIQNINGQIMVDTGSEKINLMTIQFEGKKPVNATAYFNNFDLSKIMLKTC